MKEGDVVANEGKVHRVEPGKYTHEVRLDIGDNGWRRYDRPEQVFAFSESNVKKEQE